MKKSGHFIIIPLLTMLLSCSLFQSDIDTVTDLMPRDTDIPGWTRSAEPSEYSSGNIKKYNRNYDELGIDRLSSCAYVSSDENKPAVTVEIIRFSEVLNSYGFFSSRIVETKFTSETSNEYYKDNFAVALRGEYTVYAFGQTGNAFIRNDLREFLKIALKSIDDNYSRAPLTDRIDILISRDKYGIAYSADKTEKPGDIDRIYYTLWIYDGIPVRVFASERNSFSDSYGIFKKKVQSGYIVAEAGTVHTAFKKESDGTYTFISVNNNWIYGCWSSPDIAKGKQITDELKLRITPFIR